MSRAALKHPSAGRLFAGGALGLGLVVTLCVLAVASYASAVQTVDHTVEVREQSYQWGAALVDVETNARAYLLQGEGVFLAGYDSSLRRERSQEETLRVLVADSPAQLRNVEAAATDANAVIASLEAAVGLAREGKRDEARAKISGFDERARDAFRAEGRRIRAEEGSLLVARRGNTRRRAALTLAAGLLIALVSSALLWAAWRRERAHDRRLTRLAGAAQGRLDAISELAAALSEARTRAEVATVIVGHAKQVAEADICTLHELDAEGSALALVASQGVAPELLGNIERITETSGSPETFATVKANRAVWAEKEADYARTHPVLASVRAKGPRAKAFWSVPLVVEGRAVGLLGVGFHAPRSFPPEERAFAETIARHCAQALVRAGVRERDDAARKGARVRSEFLAKAGEALVASLDYEATLKTVARLAVPELADWCAVELLEPGATASRQVAVGHIDPAKIEFARALGERYPPDPNAVTGVPQVIRSGESELYPEISRELLERAVRDDDHLRMIRELKLESAMIVPLRAHDRTFGAITFIYADSGRRFGEDDLAFAEDFARRAALAIENAVALRATEAARVQEQALRADAELASRAKDEFLATVSHELRTPLNAILGWTVMLRRRQLAPDVDRGLAVLERNARAQAKLIEEVLDISRVISGKLVLNLSLTNLGAALAAAVDTVTPAAEAKEIALAVDIADPDLEIKADPDRLQQIVWNLLSNAVKFTAKGGHVRLEAHREGSDVVIAVADDGEGIRSDVLPLIFEPFHQGDASTTRRHGGLGLGLAIAKQLVSAHGGTVHAESAGPSKGATFTVHLPARAAVAAVRRSARPPASPAPPPVNAGALRLSGLRLVVVDDEPDALDLVVEVLREQGAQVHPASSARQALALVAELRPDVVVSDVGMPDMDGHALIREVRALAPNRGGGTPAVALTAYARSEDADRAFAAGFQVHMAKPVEPSRLVSAVADLGGRARGVS